VTIDEVRFVVDGATFAIDERTATILAENLRLTGEFGTQGRDGALEAADAIEAVLVGRTEGPVDLHDETAEALFYALNVTSGGESPALVALYAAVRDAHERRLRAD
jgi:hypothetical protein